MAEETQAAVLVVDDEPSVLRLIKRVLERRHYLVVDAACGEAAMRAAEGQRFLAAIVDLTLPDLPGAQVARRLREGQPDLPLVITSGYDEREARRAAGDAEVGELRFLQKPFTPATLIELLEQLL